MCDLCPAGARRTADSSSASIDNPLLYPDEDELKRDVRAFYTRYNLENVLDETLLVRGALLAKDDAIFKASSDLDPIEVEALEREANPKLREQTRALNTILLTCCIGAIVQGWSQTSITGANLQWPYALGLQTEYLDSGTISNFWIFGGVNAIVYFAASSIGAWLSDPLNEYFWGRRGALFVASLFTFVASIGSAFASSWQSLFVCRLFLGIGYGAKASVVPIFESEVCPSKTRGRLLVSWQTFTAVGIFLGSAVNLLFHGPQNVSPPGSDVPVFPGSDDSWRQKVAWRLQLASCAIPAIPLLCLTIVCSEYVLLDVISCYIVLLTCSRIATVARQEE